MFERVYICHYIVLTCDILYLLQLAARQRRQQEEEAAKLKATSSHRYSASRSNFQRELSPQSHDSDVTKSISVISQIIFFTQSGF